MKVERRTVFEKCFFVFKYECSKGSSLAFHIRESETFIDRNFCMEHALLQKI